MDYGEDGNYKSLFKIYIEEYKDSTNPNKWHINDSDREKLVEMNVLLKMNNNEYQFFDRITESAFHYEIQNDHKLIPK